MKRKFTVYPQSIKASRSIYSASNISDFEITKNGVLVKYNGPGRDVVIPNSVTSISDNAFRNCISLTSIKIPDSVTSIGYAAFRDCRGLTSVVIPDSVTSLGEDAFAKCFSLTSITIPESVTSIGEGAFNSCRSLTSVKIPSGVTSISDYAFADCTDLTTVEIPDSVKSIGEDAFKNCNKLQKDVKKFISQFYSYDEDEYDNEISFADWYHSDEGESDGIEFVDKLESLVRSNYNVDEFFEEPSTQGYQGGDFIWITLSGGNKYEFVFDWYDEQSAIYTDGPDVAAEHYFQEIQNGIDSGSALTE